MKLSPAQRKVLEAMAEGAEIKIWWSLGGSKISLNGMRLTWTTVDVLMARKLIAYKPNDGDKRVITDAGREALKQ